MKKLVKWLSNRLGYKIVMVKIAPQNIIIDGDNELVKYVDVSGYTFKKEPLKREYPKRKSPEQIKPITEDKLNEIKNYNK